ncbi:MAG: DnaJ domain-containing protein [Atopobiaceae bacterium]|nr:DnaJ domain-containing protein [Atopobiaceae bacterium]
MDQKDYYAILGVESDATTDQIRKAFQKKAVKLHPDVNKEPDAEERFKEISEAYAVLSDPEKRSRYDAMRSGNPFASGMPHSQSGSYGGGWSQGTGGAYGPFTWGFPFGQAAYNTQRRSSSRAYNPRAGADILYELELDRENATTGCRRAVSYQRYGVCHACDGTGSVTHAGASTCPSCSGTGSVTVKIPAEISVLFGGGVMRVSCPECEGSGKVVVEPCSSCSGTGRQVSASELVVEVPAGVHDGQEIRFEGKGNVGTNNSPAGDFVCRIGIPSERLSQRSAMGFMVLGWSLGVSAPSAVLALMVGARLSLGIAIIPLVFAVFMLVTGGVLGKNRHWWANAARTLVNGFTNGLLVGLFFAALNSCSLGYVRRGVGYVLAGKDLLWL